jgi:dihydroorotate dehydrogenase electron transfer subunit
MISENAVVISNTENASGLWQIELAAGEIPELVVPGQYVHLGLKQRAEHILRRPFSVHRVSVAEDGRASVAENSRDSLTLTYQAVGELTTHMTELLPGDSVDLLGPLGQGWQLPVRVKRALFVGGGVGWAALAMAAGALSVFSVETHLLVGARNAETVNALAVGISDRPFPLNQYGSEAETGSCLVHTATDDGSLGYHGFNTGLLPDLLDRYQFDYIATCGPEAMQKIVAQMAIQRGINCQVSLERRMACGLGACLSCTVFTVNGNRKVCSDGPVFNATEIIW